jgi:hypothetical protein
MLGGAAILSLSTWRILGLLLNILLVTQRILATRAKWSHQVIYSWLSALNLKILCCDWTFLSSVTHFYAQHGDEFRKYAKCGPNFWTLLRDAPEFKHFTATALSEALIRPLWACSAEQNHLHLRKSNRSKSWVWKKVLPNALVGPKLQTRGQKWVSVIFFTFSSSVLPHL